MTVYSGTGAGVLSSGRVNQVVGFAFGAVFVLVGLSGFVVSGGHHAVGADGGDLAGLFRVNVLHNSVHLIVGAVMIAAAIMGNRAARNANATFGAIYFVLFLAGLFAIGTAANLIALNLADNLLHLGLALALLGVALIGDRGRV